jgi:hypothetical protein
MLSGRHSRPLPVGGSAVTGVAESREKGPLTGQRTGLLSVGWRDLPDPLRSTGSRDDSVTSRTLAHFDSWSSDWLAPIHCAGYPTPAAEFSNQPLNGRPMQPKDLVPESLSIQRTLLVTWKTDEHHLMGGR